MYTDISFPKFTWFVMVLAGLFLTVGGTFYAKRYVSFADFSLPNLASSVSRDLKSIEYNLTYSGSGKWSGYLASLSAFFGGNNFGSENVGAGVAEDIPVLVYHGIVANPDRFSMTSQTFSDQMFALKKAGYKTISIEELENFIKGGKVPDKSFLLTFDDGRRDSFEGADPVLKALGFKAVMFVATADSLLKENDPYSYYLDKTTLKKMVESGRWELGSHAIQQGTNEGQIVINSKGDQGNFLSNKMWLSDHHRLETDNEYITRITDELSNSKKQLEEAFNIKVTAFSYPFSDFGQQTKNNPQSQSVIARLIKKNYLLAFQQIWPVDNSYILNFPDTDPYHLRRIETGTSWTGKYLMAFLDSGRTKDLPYSDSFATDNGWSGTWGKEEISGNKLHLSATASTTGAFAFLDGSRNFKNFTYAVNVFLEKGSHVSLLARFKDADNYVSCVFSEGNVRVEEKANGTKILLSSVKNDLSVPYPLATLGVSVNGSDVSCLEGSTAVAYGKIQNSTVLDHGGIAMQVWSPTVNNASVFVNSIKAVTYEENQALIKTLPNYLKSLTKK